jgi:membrane peptidoglycan carboxypeptidase
VPSWRLLAGLSVACLLAVIALVAIAYETAQTPDLNNLRLPTATVYEYSDGTPFYMSGQDRVVIPASQIPPVAAHAVVAIENPTFYTDAGISPRGTLRALVNDSKGGSLQGGSTITQQFVKNAYLTDAQSLSRKLSEIFIAAKITRSYSKTEILTGYFNTVYFGRGAYGLDAAAETYFGIPARQVASPAQAAYLAALVNAPAVLSQPDPADQAALRQRWTTVLNDMVKYHYLTARARAAARWPRVLPFTYGADEDADGVNESAMAEVADSYLDELHAENPRVPSSATAEQGGDVIVTTFTRAAMTAAVRAVDDGLYNQLNPGAEDQAAADKDVQVGVATVNAGNGELLGFYPGRSDYNNATMAQVDPGSLMEAFAQVAPSSSSGDSLWTLMGKVGLTADLIANPAELVEPVFQLKVDPRLALGIAPESPARMADAFSVFANGGTYHNLAMVRSVTVQGKQAWTYKPAGSTVLDEAGTPASSVTSQSAVMPADRPGTIGGDDTAWYAGYQGDTVTTVGLWDQSINAKDQTVEHSLAGLGGFPAQDSFEWAESIWNADMKTISPPNPDPANAAGSLSTGIRPQTAKQTVPASRKLSRKLPVTCRGGSGI